MTVEGEIARLAEAIAAGGELPALLGALKARQARNEQLQHAIAAAVGAQATQFDRRQVERHVRARLTEWTKLPIGSVEDGRELLRQVLQGPIRFTPEPTKHEYHFIGSADLGRLFAGVAFLAPLVTSPTGFEPVFWP